MPVRYVVLAYDSDEHGATPIALSPLMTATSYTFRGLDVDTTTWFEVVARDHLGWESDPSGPVSTTIDATGPSAAEIDDGPNYVGGSAVTLTWDAAVDEGVGDVTHRLVAYADEAMTKRVYVGEWTSATEGDVLGLAGNVPHWIVVEARDGFGNVGETSNPVTKTLDKASPTLATSFAIFGPDEDELSGTCSDAGSGVAKVEASADGGATWVEGDVDDDEWTVDIDDLGDDVTEVMVRAEDAVGNVMDVCLVCVVDHSAPEVSIAMPDDDAVVSGAVAVIGSVSDAHLATYKVECREDGSSTWTSVQPETATSGVTGVLATWVTTGVPGGTYTIRVTAVDALGQSAEDEVTVVLKGAFLAIGPGDISFSDSHPLPGDKVTVLVTVRNDGDSPAEDVTVRVYDGGTEVGQMTGVTVPPHGVAVVPVEVEASGDHEFKARAESDLYDSGEMTTGQPLQTIEEETTLENAGGILGLVGIILAVFAIVLAMMMGRRGGGNSEPAPAASADVIVDPMLESVPAQEPQPLPSQAPPEQVEVEQFTPQRPRT
jgi:hypothetical protein